MEGKKAWVDHSPKQKLRKVHKITITLMIT